MNNTILIVDDIPNNIHVIQNALIEEDYSFRIAINGKQALQRAVVEPLPNLILLDIMMPDIDGYEVCKNLKENPITKNIPIIFITAKGEIEDESFGFKLGAVDYITKPISIPILKARVQTHLSLVHLNELDTLAKSAIHMLAEAGHYNDTDTGVHIWRMAEYSKILAEAAGWSKEDVDLIELAAPMHDTGKIGIDDSILKAPRKLDKDEWEIMKNHSTIGYEILKKSESKTFKMAAQIALAHHEKWDGSGYPNGLKNEEIPESARIVAIADVFDALTMKRPYKEPWSIEDALKELKKSSGNHFEPRLVDLFINNIDKVIEVKNKWDKQDK